MKTGKRYTPRASEDRGIQYGHTNLEWEVGTAVYARQSTQNQRSRNIASAEIQTEKLLEFAYKAGAPQDNRTILYDENVFSGQLRSASGRLRIDQREGLSALCERIERGEAKVVVAFMVDRLFRDEYLIGPGTFVKLCKEHNCKLVLYSGMVFDFSIDWHQQQFFMESLAAANYLKMMRERLDSAKWHLSGQGLYDGRNTPVGYIVDKRRRVDGHDNPSYKRYVIYEPHAQVVAWLFQRFYDLGGDFAALCREVSCINGGYIFPPFEDGLEDYVTKATLGEHGDDGKRLPITDKGFTVSREGLLSILTNADYIGDWRLRGETVQVNNHPAIVSREQFEFARQALSEGQVGRVKPRVRKLFIPALLNGILTYPGGFVYVIDNTINGKRYTSYGASNNHRLIGQKYEFTIDCGELDSLFTDRLLMHIQQTPSLDKWQRQTRPSDEEAKRSQLAKQLEEVEDQMESVVQALDTLKDKELIRRKEARYAELKRLRTGIVAELNAPAKQDPATAVWNLRELLIKVRDEGKWDKLSLDKRQQLVKALTVSVSMSLVSSHWLRLDVEWLDTDWGIETAYIYRRVGASPVWSKEERELFKSMWPVSTKEEILRTFPDRNWSGLIVQANRLKVTRPNKKPSAWPVPNTLTLHDWQFMQQMGISLTEEDMSLSKVAYWSSLACTLQQRNDAVSRAISMLGTLFTS